MRILKLNNSTCQHRFKPYLSLAVAEQRSWSDAGLPPPPLQTADFEHVYMSKAVDVTTAEQHRSFTHTAALELFLAVQPSSG